MSNFWCAGQLLRLHPLNTNGQQKERSYVSLCELLGLGATEQKLIAQKDPQITQTTLGAPS